MPAVERNRIPDESVQGTELDPLKLNRFFICGAKVPFSVKPHMLKDGQRGRGLVGYEQKHRIMTGGGIERTKEEEEEEGGGGRGGGL